MFAVGLRFQLVRAGYLDKFTVVDCQFVVADAAGFVGGGKGQYRLVVACPALRVDLDGEGKRWRGINGDLFNVEVGNITRLVFGVDRYPARSVRQGCKPAEGAGFDHSRLPVDIYPDGALVDDLSGHLYLRPGNQGARRRQQVYNCRRLGVEDDAEFLAGRFTPGVGGFYDQEVFPFIQADGGLVEPSADNGWDPVDGYLEFAYALDGTAHRDLRVVQVCAG